MYIDVLGVGKREFRDCEISAIEDTQVGQDGSLVKWLIIKCMVIDQKNCTT